MAEASEKHKPIIDAFNFMSNAASKAQGPGCDEAFFDKLKENRVVLGEWIEATIVDDDEADRLGALQGFTADADVVDKPEPETKETTK